MRIIDNEDIADIIHQIVQICIESKSSYNDDYIFFQDVGTVGEMIDEIVRYFLEKD